MKLAKGILEIVVFAGLLNLIFTYNAQAYIDPGTGSYMFQMFIATILGASFAVKTYWQKIIGFITKPFSKDSKDLNPND